MKQTNYVRYDNQFHRPRKRRPDYALLIMIGLTVGLMLAVIGLGIFTLFNKDDAQSSSTSSSQPSGVGTTPGETGIVIATPSPTPVVERLSNQNPVLYPATAKMSAEIGTIASEASPSTRGIAQQLYQGDTVISDFNRNPAIQFSDPLFYQSVPGILTFRGNNFRNNAAWGTLGPSVAGTLEQVWEFRDIGSLGSSAWAFSWGGTGWTGQPLIVQWDAEIRQMMNLYPDKKAKENLVEVIQVALDGKIYFFDLDDGSLTRDPINVGATIKGTPALDSRGYPILYVGQGDNNGSAGQIGFRIYSLINGQVLHFQNGLDSRAHRSNWGACDSSPILCADTDTLIYPSENGMIYTLKLNTTLDKANATVSVSPEVYAYRFQLSGVSGSKMGIESSMSIYAHYGYFSDNSGNLFCVDLNTMQVIWSRQLDDDTDVTPVIEEDNGRVYIYTGTEVDWQKDEIGYYQGAAYTYKIDAMTGEEVWQTSYSCWTKKAENSGDDVNGGVLGTPIIGKKSISNLVIFSYCMTQGAYSGNALVAYNKLTGEKVWEYSMNLYSWSSPVDCYDDAGNAYIVMCDSGGQVHYVNAANGQRLTYLQTIRNKGLSNETKEGLNMESSPSVFNNTMVIGTRSGSVFGIKIG